jgi:hypothetical protein
MADERKSTGSEARGGAGSVVVMALLLLCAMLPLLYVLSTGPAIWCVRQGALSDDQFLTFYFPLAWLYLNIDAARAFFDWYLAFWDATR